MKKYLVTLLVLGSLVANVSPCLAGSKTATLRVSCTILPSIELSGAPNSADMVSDLQTQQPELTLLAQNSQIHVNTNLGNNYRVVESFLRNAGTNIKLYSVTAL